MIAVGIQPSSDLHLDATRTVGFSTAFLPVTNIVFAYASHVAFFSFISEIRDPREFPKALFLLQATDISMYVAVAIIIYRYTGRDVKSLALGSASNVVMKDAYGIALPTVSSFRLPAADGTLKLIDPAGGRDLWSCLCAHIRGISYMSRRTRLSIGR